MNHTDSRPEKPDRIQWTVLGIATGIIVVVIVTSLTM